MYTLSGQLLWIEDIPILQAPKWDLSEGMKKEGVLYAYNWNPEQCIGWTRDVFKAILDAVKAQEADDSSVFNIQILQEGPLRVTIDVEKIPDAKELITPKFKEWREKRKDL